MNRRETENKDIIKTAAECVWVEQRKDIGESTAAGQSGLGRHKALAGLTKLLMTGIHAKALSN